MTEATLGGMKLPSDPDSVNMSFDMKTADTKALGGKVIQVYGVTVSDITITGSHPHRNRGGRVTEGWEEQLRFREALDALATEQETARVPEPLRFRWPHKGFDLDVFLKSYQSPDSYDSTDDTMDKIHHRWKLVLFIANDRSQVLTKGLKDLYLKRLMDGVGWKQTQYNGPTEMDVDSLLKGRSFSEYLSDEANAAAQGKSTDVGQLPGEDGLF